MFEIQDHGGMFGGKGQTKGKQVIKVFASLTPPIPLDIGDVWVKTDKATRNPTFLNKTPTSPENEDHVIKIGDIELKFDITKGMEFVGETATSVTVSHPILEVLPLASIPKITFWENSYMEISARIGSYSVWNALKNVWEFQEASYWDGVKWVLFSQQNINLLFSSKTTFAINQYDASLQFIKSLPDIMINTYHTARTPFHIDDDGSIYTTYVYSNVNTIVIKYDKSLNEIWRVSLSNELIRGIGSKFIYVAYLSPPEGTWPTAGTIDKQTGILYKNARSQGSLLYVTPYDSSASVIINDKQDSYISGELVPKGLSLYNPVTKKNLWTRNDAELTGVESGRFAPFIMPDGNIAVRNNPGTNSRISAIDGKTIGILPATGDLSTAKTNGKYIYRIVGFVKDNKLEKYDADFNLISSYTISDKRIMAFAVEPGNDYVHICYSEVDSRWNDPVDYHYRKIDQNESVIYDLPNFDRRNVMIQYPAFGQYSGKW